MRNVRNALGRVRQGRGTRAPVVTAVVATAAVAVGVVVAGGGPVERPGRPGGGLAAQLDALRGANDLVRSTRADVGRDPALYPTAYGRLEAGLAARHGSGERVPEVRPDALADLARTDALDTPAWRAHYVCLSLGGAGGTSPAGAAAVLDRAGIRGEAEREALARLRHPEEDGDDPLTSLATRAAFLQTLTCLGRDGDVPRAALTRLAADAARTAEAVPVLYAVEALRGAGVEGRATRALRDAGGVLEGGCGRVEPMQRAALTLLRQRVTDETRSCLRSALGDRDTQTRWLVRRALALGPAASSSAPRRSSGAAASSEPPPALADVRPDGLVAKSPEQMGTLTATYHAAGALTAAGRQGDVPGWLTKRLKELGSDPRLDPSDRVPLAMTCHRLNLACGPQDERGRREAAGRKVPARLTNANERGWYGAMAVRAEFASGCPRTSVELPDAGSRTLSPRSLRVITVLADAGCAVQAERLTRGTDLVAQARDLLRKGELVFASAAVQAALASEQTVPQALWEEIPRLLERHRDAAHPDLYAPAPGGTATAEATRAAYYLLA
ncbi:hypothetical protein ACIRPP_19020 [Streptomyces sp. NPDC101219]|uniref:hypothetical protein n=1 Tax=Streptomyces sp. NPDC101219 TaxID=3366131 RepID=UPI00381E7130